MINYRIRDWGPAHLYHLTLIPGQALWPWVALCPGLVFWFRRKFNVVVWYMHLLTFPSNKPQDSYLDLLAFSSE